MWRILLDDETLHDPSIGITVASPMLVQQVNAADQLTFSITPDHALYASVRGAVLTGRVRVERDGNPVSYGRVLAVETHPLTATCDVTVEGELAYLADAVMPEYDFSGTPAQFLRSFVAAYTAQCGQGFAVGKVTVDDSNDYIVRGNERPSPLLPELLSKTVESSTGGVLQIRHEDGVRYLDWLAAPEASGSQPIAKGSNLLDLSATLDGAQLVTAVMPIGAEQDDGTLVRMPSGPDGLVLGNVWRKGDYLYNKALFDAYGWHAQVRQWEDVTLPPNLLTKATAMVEALGAEQVVEASAVDLRDAGFDVDAIAIGQRVSVECDDIVATTYVTGCEYHLDDPSASTYSFGRLAELTESVAVADSAGWTEPTVYAKKATVDGRLNVSGVVDLGNIGATGPYCRCTGSTTDLYFTLHDDNGDLHQWRLNSTTGNVALRHMGEDAWGGWQTPNLQTGSVTVTPVSNNVVAVEVTFPRPFASVPKVFLTIQTGVNASLRYWNFGATYVTETGFTLNVSNSSTTLTARTINWLAVVAV